MATEGDVGKERTVPFGDMEWSDDAPGEERFLKASLLPPSLARFIH